MARGPPPTWCFALVVIRQDDRFLVIRERKHGQLWYLPAGRVEPGEDFFTAARREAEEEAGFSVSRFLGETDGDRACGAHPGAPYFVDPAD